MMRRHARALWGLLIGLLIGGVLADTPQAQNVTNAIVIQSLRNMGLFGQGYADGEVPTWDTTTLRYIPGTAGGPFSEVTSTSWFRGGVTPGDCTAPTYSFTADTDTGMDRTAANTISICVGGAGELVVTAGGITPTLNDGGALGTASLMWSDLFLANESVINWNNGDVTLTHAANLLTLAGGNLALGEIHATTQTTATNNTVAFKIQGGVGGDSYLTAYHEASVQTVQLTAGRTVAGVNMPLSVKAESVTINAGGANAYIFNTGGTFGFNGQGILMDDAAPTIASGFGTSPSVPTSNGTAAFTVNVGTGGTATNGVITMPAARTGWICHVENRTGVLGNYADQRTVQIATTTTSITLENQAISTGAALAWTASDLLQVSCTGY